MESLKPFLIGLTLLLCCVAFDVEALICFETDFDTGRVELKNCPNCTYCVITSDGVHHDNTVLFGLSSENEDLQNYNSIFSVDREVDGVYKVLSFCLLERYYIGKKEYLLRCLCNSNLCNGAATITEFIDRQVENDTNKRKYLEWKQNYMRMLHQLEPKCNNKMLYKVQNFENSFSSRKGSAN